MSNYEEIIKIQNTKSTKMLSSQFYKIKIDLIYFEFTMMNQEFWCEVYENSQNKTKTADTE